MGARERRRCARGSRGGRGPSARRIRGSRSRSRSRTTSRSPRGRPCRTGPRWRRASATCSASASGGGSARSGSCASSPPNSRSNCSRSCATPTREVMLGRARRTGAGIVYRTGSGPTRSLGRRSAERCARASPPVHSPPGAPPAKFVFVEIRPRPAQRGRVIELPRPRTPSRRRLGVTRQGGGRPLHGSRVGSALRRRVGVGAALRLLLVARARARWSFSLPLSRPLRDRAARDPPRRRRRTPLAALLALALLARPLLLVAPLRVPNERDGVRMCMLQ